MATKRKASPQKTNEAQKLTQKQMEFSLAVNVNDEATTGFKQLQNINPNKQLKAITPRAGIRQRENIGNPLSSNPVPFTESFNFVPAFTGTYAFGTVTYIVGTTTQVGMTDYVYQSSGFNKLSDVSYYAQAFPATTGNITLRVYQFDPSTNTQGNLIDTSTNTIDISTLYGVPTAYTLIKFNMNSQMLEKDKFYLFDLQSSTATTVNFTAVALNPVPGQSYGVYQQNAPTLPQKFINVQEPIFGCPGYSMSLVAIGSQSNVVPDITAIQVSNQDDVPSFYISSKQLTQSQANLGSLTLAKTDGTVQPMIVDDGLGVVPVPNANIGVGIINPSYYKAGYVAAFYGSKMVGFNHNWGLFYGSQLKNRVKTVQYTSTINTTPNTNTPNTKTVVEKVMDDAHYLMFKRYKQEPTDTSDVIIPILGEVIVDAPTINSFGYTQDWRNAKTHSFLSGVYEYAIEWIDNQGFSYNPGTYDPSSYTTGAISPYQSIHGDNAPGGTGLDLQIGEDVVVYDTTSMQAYNQRGQNTRFIVDCTFNNPTILAQASTSDFRFYLNVSGASYHDNRIAYVNFGGYAISMTIPVPKFPTTHGWSCNIYRRTLSQVDITSIGNDNAQQFPRSQPGSTFVRVGSINTITAGVTTVSFYDNFPTPSGPTFDLDYYIPRAADMEQYKGHLIAIGDPLYPNFIFPSRNPQPDFHLDDAFELAFPPGDTYFTAIATLGDDCFLFSNHGTILLKQTSQEPPYFINKVVSTNLGCICTSKGIVKVGQRLLIPTSEGLKWFDGSSFISAEVKLNNIWNQIDYSQQNWNFRGTDYGYVPAFDIQAIYDPLSKQVFYLMPKVANEPQTIYVLNIQPGQNTMSYVGVGSSEWSTTDNNSNTTSLYYDAFKGTIGCSDGTSVFILDKAQTVDSLNNIGSFGIPIQTIIESLDVDFAEKTQIVSFRVWGNGLIDKLSLYSDRSLVADGVVPSILLDTYGAKGKEIPLNYAAKTYFRWKIESTDPKFVLKGWEVVYKNQGVKSFDDVQ